MPGRMGNRRVTRDNLQVVKIDPARNLLYLRGSVPGNKGGMVRVTDARKKTLDTPPPFPTYFASSDGENSQEMMKPKGDIDPLKYD